MVRETSLRGAPSCGPRSRETVPDRRRPRLDGIGSGEALRKYHTQRRQVAAIAVHLWHIDHGFHLGAFYQSLPVASPASD